VPFLFRLGEPDGEDPVFEVRRNQLLIYLVRQQERPGKTAVPAF